MIKASVFFSRKPCGQTGGLAVNDEGLAWNSSLGSRAFLVCIS